MKLGFIVIYVEDVSASLAFYRKAMKLEVRLTYPEQGVMEYAELQSDGAILCLASHNMGMDNLQGKYLRGSLAEQPFAQQLAFVVDDVNTSFDCAISAGAMLVKSPHQKPWGQTVAYIRSLDGTLIEFCSDMQS